MTDNNAPNYSEAEVEAAQNAEKAALQEVTLQYFENRVVALSIELSRRERDIQVLEKELTALQASVRAEQASARRRETPETVIAEAEEASADTSV